MQPGFVVDVATRGTANALVAAQDLGSIPPTVTMKRLSSEAGWNLHTAPLCLFKFRRSSRGYRLRKTLYYRLSALH